MTLLLVGAFLVVAEVVSSVRVCTAGELCSPVVTLEAVVTATFGAALLYVSYDSSRRSAPCRHPWTRLASIRDAAQIDAGGQICQQASNITN